MRHEIGVWSCVWFVNTKKVFKKKIELTKIKEILFNLSSEQIHFQNQPKLHLNYQFYLQATSTIKTNCKKNNTKIGIPFLAHNPKNSPFLQTWKGSSLIGDFQIFHFLLKEFKLLCLFVLYDILNSLLRMWTLLLYQGV